MPRLKTHVDSSRCWSFETRFSLNRNEPHEWASHVKFIVWFSTPYSSGNSKECKVEGYVQFKEEMSWKELRSDSFSRFYRWRATSKHSCAYDYIKKVKGVSVSMYGRPYPFTESDRHLVY